MFKSAHNKLSHLTPRARWYARWRTLSVRQCRTVQCKSFPWLLFGLVLLASCPGIVTVGQAGDWLQADFPYISYDPLRLPRKRWVRLSVQAGEYRTVIKLDGDTSVARSLAIMPSIFVTAPDLRFQPYIGVGVGLSITDVAPGTARVPLHLEESLVLQVGGGVVYHLGHGLSLISRAHFAQFKAADLLGRILPTALPLHRDGLDFQAYTLELVLRLLY